MSIENRTEMKRQLKERNETKMNSETLDRCVYINNEHNARNNIINRAKTVVECVISDVFLYLEKPKNKTNSKRQIANSKYI